MIGLAVVWGLTLLPTVAQLVVGEEVRKVAPLLVSVEKEAVVLAEAA